MEAASGDDSVPFAPATEHALDASNRGYRLLAKLGWRSGLGLGKHEQGRRRIDRTLVE
jgi:hypothetical protein